MTHLLNNLYQSIEQRLAYSKTSTSFKDLIELCFIDLNGDLNCFKYLTKTVKLFFQSTFTVEHYTTRSKLIDLDHYFNLKKTKYELYLQSRVNSFTFEIIYKLCTAHLIKDDHLFQDILKYVEKSLDQAHIFSSKNDSNKFQNFLSTAFNSSQFKNISFKCYDQMQ